MISRMMIKRMMMIIMVMMIIMTMPITLVMIMTDGSDNGMGDLPITLRKPTLN